MGAASASAAVPTWTPLRHRMFRALWLAQFASNVGTFMQLVAAQWLMGDLGGSALEVALVQAATSLPVFLLVLPAGALGDVLDRRRVLLTSQAFTLVAAAGLAATTLAGRTSEGVLLALTFAVGAGQALAIPSFQAVLPELVGRPEIPQAAALNGVNYNLARAIGPAAGGALIAAAGPGWVFALNAVSFLGTLAVVGAWRRPPDRRAFGAEHVGAALTAGARFVRSAPSLKAVLGRAGLFMAAAGSLWALLPVLARGDLGLAAPGYGLLLASVGVGAVLGALQLGRLRGRFGVDGAVRAASLAYAVALLGLAAVDVVAVAVVALVLAGAAWIVVLASLTGSAQTLLPDWARARGLAYVTLTNQGAQALGAVVWGTVAGMAGADVALVAAAVVLVAGVLAGRRLRLPATDLDLRPAAHWEEPHLSFDPDPAAGPVLVTVEWRVDPANADAFRAAMAPVERSRRRTGARRWGLFRDGEDPSLFLETFTVATWQEHLRQHEERATVRDRELEEAARALSLDGGPARVRHLFAAREGRGLAS